MKFKERSLTFLTIGIVTSKSVIPNELGSPGGTMYTCAVGAGSLHVLSSLDTF